MIAPCHLPVAPASPNLGRHIDMADDPQTDSLGDRGIHSRVRRGSPTHTSQAAGASPEAKYRLTFALERSVPADRRVEINAGSLSGIVMRISSIDVRTEV